MIYGVVSTSDPFEVVCTALTDDTIVHGVASYTYLDDDGEVVYDRTIRITDPIRFGDLRPGCYFEHGGRVCALIGDCVYVAGITISRDSDGNMLGYGDTSKE